MVSARERETERERKRRREGITEEVGRRVS